MRRRAAACRIEQPAGRTAASRRWPGREPPCTKPGLIHSGSMAVTGSGIEMKLRDGNHEYVLVDAVEGERKSRSIITG